MSRVAGRSPVRYFHGGARGRKVGDLLLPPDETGAKPLKDWMRPEGGSVVSVDHVRTDRVFITSRLPVARLFAGFCPPKGGALYAVRPVGEIEVDPDYHGVPPISFQCETAEVRAVIEPAVAPVSFTEFVQAMERFG